MKAITEYTDEEYIKMHTKHVNLIDALGAYKEAHQEEIDQEQRDWVARQIYGPWYFSSLTRRSGYAHYTFEGTISPRLTEALGRMPDNDEIIMLVDGGFSHFGATCSTMSDGSFRGRVNVD